MLGSVGLSYGFSAACPSRESNSTTSINMIVRPRHWRVNAPASGTFPPIGQMDPRSRKRTEILGKITGLRCFVPDPYDKKNLRYFRSIVPMSVRRSQTAGLFCVVAALAGRQWWTQRLGRRRNWWGKADS
jgi:hypothetical protein